MVSCLFLEKAWWVNAVTACLEKCDHISVAYSSYMFFVFIPYPSKLSGFGNSYCMGLLLYWDHPYGFALWWWFLLYEFCKALVPFLFTFFLDAYEYIRSYNQCWTSCDNGDELKGEGIVFCIIHPVSPWNWQWVHITYRRQFAKNRQILPFLC